MTTRFDGEVWEGGDVPDRYLYVSYRIEESGRIELEHTCQTIDAVRRIRLTGTRRGIFEIIVYGNTIPVTDRLYKGSPNTVKEIIDIRDITDMRDPVHGIYTRELWNNINKRLREYEW